MVVHDFICDKCKIQTQDMSSQGVHRCPNCCGEMRWDIGFGCAVDQYYHVSESLGINPLDAAEHREHWPNIDVLPDGRVGFHSVKEQERYANHFGMDKKEQRRR